MAVARLGRVRLPLFVSRRQMHIFRLILYRFNHCANLNKNGLSLPLLLSAASAFSTRWRSTRHRRCHTHPTLFLPSPPNSSRPARCGARPSTNSSRHRSPPPSSSARRRVHRCTCRPSRPSTAGHHVRSPSLLPDLLLTRAPLISDTAGRLQVYVP